MSLRSRELQILSIYRLADAWLLRSISGRHQSIHTNKHQLLSQLYKQQASGSSYTIEQQPTPSITIDTQSTHQPQLILNHMPITSFPSATTNIKPTSMNSNSGNSSNNNNMSLIGHNGGLSIRKAEQPTSSSSSTSSPERRGLGQMLSGILHGQRRDEAYLRADDSSETASLSSVATEKRALLGGKRAPSLLKSSTRKIEPRMPNINESVVPRGGFR
ncbi:hypothetical protein ACQKWADRAFT_306097 [Trichoderma austrokoningii]